MSETSGERSLYERLGGAEGIEAISADIVDRHLVNPVIKTRFAEVDAQKLKGLVADFFSMGSDGPAKYEGRDMRAAHRGMNISERELVAAVDDVLAALDARDVDPESRNEVLAILYSLKDEVLFQ